MARPKYYGSFDSLKFPKKGEAIIAKAKALRFQLQTKIDEREGRIRDAASEAGMKDAGDVFMSLQTIADGSTGGGDINMTVGLAAKIKGELAEMNREREEVKKLNMIINNLPSDQTFELGFDELEYFGF